LYDATVGTNWTQCRGSRPDPCRCATDYGKVTCSKDAAGNNHITGIALTSGGNAPPFGLSGTLPEELTNLTALTFLDLSFNEHLYGSIPSGISGLSALTSLALNRNQFTGTIPPGIGQLLALITLGLQYNLFNGSIPESLVKLTNVTLLHLAGNRLTGTVPNLNFPQYTRHCQIEDPDALTNHFQCPLPPDSETCYGWGQGPPTCSNYCTGKSANLVQSECDGWVEFYDRLGGSGWTSHSEYRSDPCNCSYYHHRYISCDNNGEHIIAISLPHNSLNGSVPGAALAAFTNLDALNLAQNFILGTLPGELVSLKKLQSIEFDNNRLTGLVPPLPFDQYKFCALDSIGGWLHHTNRYACPLPPNASMCSERGQLACGPIGWVELKSAIYAQNGTSFTVVLNPFDTSDYDSQIVISSTTNVTIRGSSDGVVLDAFQKGRFFKVEEGGNLTLDSVTLQNGLPASLSSTSTQDWQGGAIYNEGLSIIIGSTIQRCQCHTNYSNPKHQEKSVGGAIVNRRGGRVSVTKSTLANNSCNAYGGAIENDGVLTIADGKFTGNYAYQGGAIHQANIFAEATLSSMTFADNRAGTGREHGGNDIWYTGGSLLFRTCDGREVPMRKCGNDANCTLPALPVCDCIGKSANLAQSECDAWIDLYDATGGTHWTHCRDNRLDPCGCADEVNAGALVSCYQDHIVDVSLSNNNLVGYFPKSIEQMPRLLKIYLGGNKISGTLPVLLSQLSRLQYLSVPMSKLTGSIPAAIWQMPSLTHIILNSNNLEGSIPDALSQLTSLQKLILNNNALNGSIPKSLARLTDVTQLALHDNRMTGLVPNLDFSQYVGTGNFCNIENRITRTNHFQCPLPLNSEQCQGGPPTCSNCIGSSAGLVPSECDAWIAFYDGLNGPKWGNCSSNRLDPCSCKYKQSLDATPVQGVFCDESGHITDLKFPTYTKSDGAFGMAGGTLPENMDAFTELTSFNLGGQEVIGPIPSGIQNLKKLVGLQISHNKFTFLPPLHFEQYTFCDACLAGTFACPLPPGAQSYCKKYGCPPTCINVTTTSPPSTTTTAPTPTTAPTTTTVAPATTIAPVTTTTAAPATTFAPTPAGAKGGGTSTTVGAAIGCVISVAVAAAMCFQYRRQRSLRLALGEAKEPLLLQDSHTGRSDLTGCSDVSSSAPGASTGSSSLELHSHSGAVSGGGTVTISVGAGAGAGTQGDAEYCGATGAPVNDVAMSEVAAEWRSGASSSGGRARVVQLAFALVQRAAAGFADSSQIGGGGSCLVFSGAIFNVPVAIKRYLVCARSNVCARLAA
jgi:Leucine-rich repeat (LRR) protein